MPKIVDARPLYEVEVVPFPQWRGIELRIVYKEKDMYVLFNPLCESCFSGLSDKALRARIARDPLMSTLLDTFRVPTAGGPQEMLGLHVLGVARLLNGVSLNHVREELRARFLNFQWDVANAAKDIFDRHFSDLTNGVRLTDYAIRARDRSTHPHDDRDTSNFLFFMADRQADIEQANHALWQKIYELAEEYAKIGKQAHTCPKCGYQFTDDEEE